jgi:hypothetical protein
MSGSDHLTPAKALDEIGKQFGGIGVPLETVLPRVGPMIPKHLDKANPLIQESKGPAAKWGEALVALRTPPQETEKGPTRMHRPGLYFCLFLSRRMLLVEVRRFQP